MSCCKAVNADIATTSSMSSKMSKKHQLQNVNIGIRCLTSTISCNRWGALADKNGQKQKFWIAANSWGKSWGENGYFRILRGQNECDIEKLILATSGQP
ncbi:hypothetical protein Q9233_004514 [Columba guinea]|nr:hypothetical protein Q9233_004514 [Columba guinea]